MKSGYVPDIFWFDIYTVWFIYKPEQPPALSFCLCYTSLVEAVAHSHACILVIPVQRLKGFSACLLYP